LDPILVAQIIYKFYSSLGLKNSKRKAKKEEKGRKSNWQMGFGEQEFFILSVFSFGVISSS